MTHRIGLALILVGLGLAAALAGPPAAAAGKECFFASQLSSWKEAGDKTVNLRVGVGDVYQLKLIAPCPDLPYAEAVGVETLGGSSTICSGLDVSLVLPHGVAQAGPQRCMATSLRKLSPEEVRALPRKEMP
jgi:hypothetical protein